MNIFETFENLKQAHKVEEAANVDSIIKELIDTDWSGSNKEQMKAVQLMKGLATSDDPKSNAFMKKVDKAMSSMKMAEAKDKKMDKFSDRLHALMDDLGRSHSAVSKAAGDDMTLIKEFGKHHKKAEKAMLELAKFLDQKL